MRYLLCLSILFAFTACSLEERIERREDRLLGTWVIDKARFDEPNELFDDDVDDEFKGDLIDFYRDGTTNYESINNDFFTGFWRVVGLREEVDGERDVEFLLDAEFFFPDGTPAFTWVGRITRLGGEDLTLRIQEPTGELRLQLDRVQ